MTHIDLDQSRSSAVCGQGAIVNAIGRLSPGFHSRFSDLQLNIILTFQVGAWSKVLGLGLVENLR